MDERFYRAFSVRLTEMRLGMTLYGSTEDLIAPFSVKLRALLRRSRRAPMPLAVVSGRLAVLRCALSSARFATAMRIVRDLLAVVPAAPAALAAVRRAMAAAAADEQNIDALDKVRVALHVQQVFVVAMVETAQSEPSELLRLQLHHAHIGVCKRHDELVVKVSLQNLDVIDMLQQHDDSLRLLASSRRPHEDDSFAAALGALDAAAAKSGDAGGDMGERSDSALINVTYTQRQPGAVAFDGVAQHVQVQLGQLYLQWNPRTLDAALRFWKQMFPPPDTLPSGGNALDGHDDK